MPLYLFCNDKPQTYMYKHTWFVDFLLDIYDKKAYNKNSLFSTSSLRAVLITFLNCTDKFKMSLKHSLTHLLPRALLCVVTQ